MFTVHVAILATDWLAALVVPARNFEYMTVLPSLFGPLPKLLFLLKPHPIVY